MVPNKNSSLGGIFWRNVTTAMTRDSLVPLDHKDLVFKSSHDLLHTNSVELWMDQSICLQYTLVGLWMSLWIGAIAQTQFPRSGPWIGECSSRHAFNFSFIGGSLCHQGKPSCYAMPIHWGCWHSIYLFPPFPHLSRGSSLLQFLSQVVLISPSYAQCGWHPNLLHRCPSPLPLPPDHSLSQRTNNA